MSKPIDPEEVKDLIEKYRDAAAGVRSRWCDPRNMGLDEYENNRQANVYDAIAIDLERLLK